MKIFKGFFKILGFFFSIALILMIVVAAITLLTKEKDE